MTIPGYDYNIWMDLSSMGHDDLWVWFSTGQAITYEMWMEGEPADPQRNHCGIMSFDPSTNSYGWKALNCGQETFALCEIRQH